MHEVLDGSGERLKKIGFVWTVQRPIYVKKTMGFQNFPCGRGLRGGSGDREGGGVGNLIFVTP